MVVGATGPSRVPDAAPAVAAAAPAARALAAAAPELIAAPPEGIYVHVPFCISHCPYCDFVVYAGATARGPRNRMADLVASLHLELDARARQVEERFGAPSMRPGLRSVYLGGGTPSLLEASQVGGLLAAVDRLLGLTGDAEITLEANPGPDEVGDMPAMRRAGITRLSIGAQSLDDVELTRLGRRHRAAHVADAVESARAAGIGSISLDLLTDIPAQTTSSWRRTLEGSLALTPDHLSVYALALDDPDAEGLTGPRGDHLPVSAGARRWRERASREQSQDRAAQMEEMTDRLASEAGLERYELANLARPGHRSRHNQLYWHRRPYLGLGPGAHSSDGALERSWNAARLDAYLEAIAAGRLPPGGTERVDEATALAERAILQLRLSEGLDREAAVSPELAAGLAWGERAGLLERHGQRRRLTARGRLLANEVFMRLLPPSEDGSVGSSAAASGASR